VKDLVRYPLDDDALAALQLATSNTLPNAEMTADVRTLLSGPG
jgi:hypothetical protein